MTPEEKDAQEVWDAHFDVNLKRVNKARNEGRFKARTTYDVLLEARRLTEVTHGPRPGEDFGGTIKDVVTAPIDAAKKGVQVLGFIGKIKSWLDGKKTTIGAILDLVATLAGAALQFAPTILPAFGVDAETVSQVIVLLGKVLMGIGLAHKYIKWERSTAVKKYIEAGEK